MSIQVTISGPQESGKTSIAEVIAAALEAAGYRGVLTDADTARIFGVDKPGDQHKRMVVIRTRQ